MKSLSESYEETPMYILFVLNWALVVSVLAKPSLLLPHDNISPAIEINPFGNAVNSSIDDFLDFETDNDDDDDDQIINNVALKPSIMAYTEGIDRLEAYGIDTSVLPKDIIEDATSTVVSDLNFIYKHTK